MGYDIASLLLLLDEMAVISFGFLGGVCFAFSFFVMQSLNKIGHRGHQSNEFYKFSDFEIAFYNFIFLFFIYRFGTFLEKSFCI